MKIIPGEVVGTTGFEPAAPADTKATPPGLSRDFHGGNCASGNADGTPPEQATDAPDAPAWHAGGTQSKNTPAAPDLAALAAALAALPPEARAALLAALAPPMAPEGGSK